MKRREKEKKNVNGMGACAWHCPEVEELLHGQLPFVTRHGVTVVIAVIAACLGLVVCVFDIPVLDILRGLFSFRL